MITGIWRKILQCAGKVCNQFGQKKKTVSFELLASELTGFPKCKDIREIDTIQPQRKYYKKITKPISFKGNMVSYCISLALGTVCV